MPDQDIIDRKVPRGWRSSVKLFTGSATERQVAKEVIQAAAKSLRENDGLPGAPLWIELLRRRISGDLDPHSAFTRGDAIAQQLQHTRHAMVANRAVKKMLLDIDSIRLHESDIGRRLAEEFIWELIDHNFFARLRPDAVGTKRFERIADVDRRQSRCRHALEPHLKKLAARLAQNPEADGLRAPRIRTGAPTSTEDILDQPLM